MRDTLESSGVLAVEMSQRVSLAAAGALRPGPSQARAILPALPMPRTALLILLSVLVSGFTVQPWTRALAAPADAADLDREAARGEALESEIEAELRRQEELMGQIGSEAAPPASPSIPSLSREKLSERADPRTAPRLPAERALPLAIFERDNVKIPAGAWGNDGEIAVIKRSLDADRDGKPEQIRYFEPRSGDILRAEQDLDYDGAIDAWSTFEDRALTSRSLDTNDDGTPDAWEQYANDRMTSREVDRDHDGVRDAFYTYEGDSLVGERHDADNDGRDDLVVTYRNRLRTLAVEDLDHDGREDSWTHYGVRRGEEVVTRIEKDTDGSGRPDLFETYVVFDGRPVLSRREEDKNNDGSIDITSIYRKGKLIKREISDPSLMPL